MGKGLKEGMGSTGFSQASSSSKTLPDGWLLSGQDVEETDSMTRKNAVEAGWWLSRINS
jgi:hypothetical protein